MRVCPVDMKPCIDDLCRGSGCLLGGGDMWEVCDFCHQPFSLEAGIECDCPPGDDYDHLDD